MINLQQIRTYALARADMSNSNFRDTLNLNYMINKSIEELYDLIISKYEDYYVKEISFTIDPNSHTFDLSTQDAVSIYKLIGLDSDLGNGRFNSLGTFSFNNRNSVNYGQTKTYRWLGNNISILPETAGAGNYRAWVIPRFTNLVSDTDNLGDDLEQWVDYVVIDVAIKLLQQEESDPSILMNQKAEMKERIISMAANRDAGQAQSIVDVNSDYDWKTGGYNYRRGYGY